ncbi:HNH endonuclease [Cryomorphaceae bacterium 1068]|nr:HNH endonuclease [Cryomorphaceae bacterium 1068]
MAKRNTPEKWVLMTELNGEPLLHHFKLSNLGNVVRMKKGEGPEEPFHPRKILGYQYISFTTRNGSRETIYLHRLVAEFFVEASSPDAEFVIHIDYSRDNNRFDNLKWVNKVELKKHRSAKAGRLPGKMTSRTRLTDPTGPLEEKVDTKSYELRRLVSNVANVVH